MVLLEIHQRFKGHFLNESRISFKYIFLWTEIVATATTATLNFSFIIQEIFSWLISEEWEVRNGEQLSQGNLQILVLKRSCSEVFYKKVVLRNFAKFTGKHLCQGLSFNKVVGRALQLDWKRDWHRCFPANIVKILRTPFLTEHLLWLLPK